MHNADLNKSIILVTGGTGGIGRAVCRLLAARGDIVVATGTTGERIRDLDRELHQRSPSSLCLQADLGFPEAWSDLVQTVGNRFGRIDVLVNCLGVLIPGSVTESTPETFERVIRVNLLSIFHGTRAVLPAMIRLQKGHIINVGSLGGIVPMPFETLYSATKFAVRGFSLSLNEELRGTGVCVSLVSPGPVRTRMLDTEAQDDRSTVSFLTSPLEPDAVAHEILRTIRHPRPEVVLPSISGNMARALSLFPGVFSRLHRAAGKRGEKNIRAYRKRYSLTQNDSPGEGEVAR